MPIYQNALTQQPTNRLAYQDRIGATPRNEYLGAIADWLAQSYAPQRTQQMQGVAQFLSLPAVSQTLDRLSYGEPLTTGAGMTTRVRPEALEAAMAVAPAAKPVTMASLQAARLARQAALATKGMPVGMSTEAVGGMGFLKPAEYRGSHKAPGPDFGAPLYDLTGGGQMYPADVYSAKAAQYYGTGYPKADKEAFALAQRVRGNPDAEITMYRAVPNDEKITSINAGDWVTLSKDYAKTHGESALKNDYKILSQKVKAKDLWTNADSIHEFGYQPQSKKSAFQYPQEEALRLAQQRAALPPSQGGLGLPANNTAEQRAAAMGGKNMVHFSRTGGDYPVLDSGQYATAPFDAVGTHVGTPQAALDRFRNTTATTDQIKGTTYPVTILGDRPLMNQAGMPWGEDELNAFLRQTGEYNSPNVRMTYPQMNAQLREKLFNEQGYTSIPYVNEVEGKGSTSFIVPPENIRSQFAAFDPWRKTAATAAAFGVAAPDLLAAESQDDINQMRKLKANKK